MKTINILFVCIGNTCRSPMAECIMKHLCDDMNLTWYVDSAGLRPWNTGRRPDERCLKVLEENGLTTRHYGRVISIDDFLTFDYIICMDESNFNELQVMADLAGKKCKAKVELLGSYLLDKGEEIIKDPFFSQGINTFRYTYNQIYQSCEMFIKQHNEDNPELQMAQNL